MLASAHWTREWNEVNLLQSQLSDLSSNNLPTNSDHNWNCILILQHPLLHFGILNDIVRDVASKTRCYCLVVARVERRRTHVVLKAGRRFGTRWSPQWERSRS